MTDSLIGYTVVGLADPPPPGDSAVGYAVVSLLPPAGTGDSLVGFATVTLTRPHLPIAVKTATGLDFVRILTKTPTGFE
jgi:hypothetical protein